MMYLDNQTYFIADLHLWHRNIIKYANRPYVLTNTDEDIRTVEQMNEDILKLFDALPDKCTIWLLGDVWFKGGRQYELLTDSYIAKMKAMVARMKGNRQLFLILGNHDTLFREHEYRVDFYKSLGFDKVYDSPVIVNDNIILSHEPVYIPKIANFYNIHGHIHQNTVTKSYFPDKEVDPRRYYNVCLDHLHKIGHIQFQRGC